MSKGLKEEIDKTIEVLKSGGTILYPTDTIWGLGCDATNFEAIDKIYSIKNRDLNKSFIILLDDDRKLNKYVREIPEVAWDLLDHSDSPLTIIYPQAVNLPQNLLAKDGSIAIRIVKDGFVQQLLKKFNKPIVSTSANFSGELSPKTKKEISKKLIESVDYMVEIETENKQNKSSSIIKLQINGEIEIIRK